MAENDKPAAGPRTEPDTAPPQSRITDVTSDGPEPRPRPDTRKAPPDPEAEPPAA